MRLITRLGYIHSYLNFVRGYRFVLTKNVLLDEKYQTLLYRTVVLCVRFPRTKKLRAV